MNLERLFDRYRRRDDVAALAEVFDRTAPELLRVATHFARDPAEAESLVQDTFLTAMQARQGFDASRRMVPWLVGILRNQVRRRWRQTRRDASGGPSAGSGGSGDVTEPVANGELADRALEALDALPEPYRPVLVLRLRHGLEPAAIAHVLNRSPATVRTQLHRGLARLRQELPQERRATLGRLGLATAGLGGVRAQVLEQAGAVATASASSAALLAGGGAILMTKNTFVAAVLIVLLLGAGGYVVTRFLDGDESSFNTARSERAARSAADTRASPTPVRLRGRSGAQAALHGATPSEGVAPRSAARGHSLPVRVVDERGRGVAGVEVRAAQRIDSDWLHFWNLLSLTPTNEEGVQHIDISAGGLLRVRAVATSETSASLPLGLGDPPETVTLRVARRINLGGRVLEPGGRAATGVSVHIQWPEGGSIEVRTDEEGRFRTRVPPGEYGLTVQAGVLENHRGDPAALLGEVRREVAPGTVDLDLRLCHPARIEGTVLGADGTPLKSGSLYAVRANDGLRPTRLGVGIDSVTGRFLVAPVRPGPWLLAALPTDGRYVALESTPVSAPVESALVVCAYAKTLEGVVRGEDVGGFKVTWVDGTHPLGPQRQTVGVKADGRFEIRRLRAVPHRLYVWRRGDPRMADLREVLPGPPPLAIDLQEGLSIRGIYRPGPPTPGSRVIAERNGIEVDALMADDGSFAVFGLTPGPWKIDVTVKNATGEMKSGPGLAIEAGRVNVALGE